MQGLSRVALVTLGGVWLALVAPSTTTYLVDDTGGMERRFDGIGGLSGGGATSKLLVSYPVDVRNQILDYLFLPNFAASLQILKVEIGGDAQSTDGTESSHMHESWDENYQRGYEWWLMVEAKKRNPAIKLYGLPWAFPGWVGQGTGNPYKFPNDTATYVIKWILAAKRVYNLDIDYIGVWNERNYDIVYIETLKSALVANGLTKVQLVAADGGWDISHDILASTTFASAVDIIGCHYPGTETSMDAMKTGKQLWASEDYSTFNDDVGAGCWARILNQNYVNGFMTSTISWNLIASYYESLPFTRDGLMTAEQPWSGHYVVDNPIWITAHTTQFTEIGWRYLQHGHGVGLLDGGGSYVSLASPQGDHLTIIIETMSHDHSVCIRPDLPAYNVTAQQAEFLLGGAYAGVGELKVWRTQLKFDGTPSTAFEHITSIRPYMGMFTMTLEPDQIYTLTTLSVGQKGSYGPPPDPKPFPFPFMDNFEHYTEYSEAYSFAPQTGVWEVRQTNDPKHSMVNRQVVLHDPIYWCNQPGPTLNVGGNFAWTDVMVSVEVFVPTVNSSLGVYAAARVDRGGCDAPNAQGIFFIVYPLNNTFLVTTDLARRSVITSGTTGAFLKNDTWANITLIIKGTMAVGYIDPAKILFQVNMTNPRKNGFVAYGTAALGIADFDNLYIQSPDSLDLHFYKSDVQQQQQAQQQQVQQQQAQQQQEQEVLKEQQLKQEQLKQLWRKGSRIGRQKL